MTNYDPLGSKLTQDLLLRLKCLYVQNLKFWWNASGCLGSKGLLRSSSETSLKWTYFDIADPTPTCEISYGGLTLRGKGALFLEGTSKLILGRMFLNISLTLLFLLRIMEHTVKEKRHFGSLTTPSREPFFWLSGRVQFDRLCTL